MGCFAMPEIYSEAQMAREQALVESYATCVEAWRSGLPLPDDNTIRSRLTGPTMPILHCDMVRLARRPWRPWTTEEQGEKVGSSDPAVASVPFDDLYRAAGGKHTLIVLDRAISFGGPGGPVAWS